MPADAPPGTVFTAAHLPPPTGSGPPPRPRRRPRAFDTGGQTAGAPLRPLVGAELVAVTLAHTLFDAGADFRVAGVNGATGVVVSLPVRVMAVIGLESDGERATRSGPSATRTSSPGSPNSATDD